jgi:Arc/MetJ-type ribon-helix-helix transcriptional regulator
MNAQINLRLPEKMIKATQLYAKKNGYNNIQEVIKESLREKLFQNSLNSEEVSLVKSLFKIAESKKLYGSEEELFKKLKK